MCEKEVKPTFMVNLFFANSLRKRQEVLLSVYPFCSSCGIVPHLLQVTAIVFVTKSYRFWRSFTSMNMPNSIVFCLVIAEHAIKAFFYEAFILTLIFIQSIDSF